MKKIFLLLTCVCCSFIMLAQRDIALGERLDSFTQATRAMDFNRIMDYSYPKIFTIVPREQLMAALEKSLHNEKFDIKYVSMTIDSLFPVFTIADGSYAKINSSIKMIMKFNFPQDESDSEKLATNTRLAGFMGQQFGAENVVLDNGNITVRVNTPLAAVKDQYAKEWSFANLTINDPITDKLFSKEVLSKFASYK